MKIVFDLDVSILEQWYLKLMECQKQSFVRQWKWLKDISGNNQAVWYLYTKFVTILQLRFVYFAIFQCLF